MIARYFPRIRGGGRFFWRRVSEFVADALMLRGWVAACTRAFGLSGTLSITTLDIALPPASRLSTSLTLAFISDFHAGPTTHPSIYAEMFQALRDLGPDVLLLGGDFVSCRAAYVEQLTGGLTACTPRLGKFAVIGNHDLYAGEGRITSLLQGAGVRVLVNENVPLPPPFEQISICGIDDPWIGAPDVSAAFAGAGLIRIFLTHSPDGLSLLDGQRFDVALAGHTHGGQIALPDGTPIYVPSGPLSRRYAHGMFGIPGNGPLIVSRGIGNSTLPLRIHADPEIVVCRLTSD